MIVGLGDKSTSTSIYALYTNFYHNHDPPIITMYACKAHSDLLQASNHYIRFAIAPPSSEALALRKVLQDALTHMFGHTSSNIYLDVLWVADNGSEFVIRLWPPAQ